jgi:hypothetical protein
VNSEQWLLQTRLSHLWTSLLILLKLSQTKGRPGLYGTNSSKKFSICIL